VPETRLSAYYRAVDDGRLDDALSMLDEKVRFVIALPSGARRSRGRAAMGNYLAGRGVPDRAHMVLREARDDDVEFVYGKVTEADATTGYFLAAASLRPDGLVTSYQVTFDTEHILLED
jgi:hypothetical protein